MNQNEIIKNYRIGADMSWREMAEQIGIKERHAVMIFNGHVKAGPRTLFKIEKFIKSNRAQIESVLGRTIEGEV